MACISSKMAYQKLIQPLSKPLTSQLYFEKVLGFGKVEWEKVYMLPRIVTIESSLRSFQYKILNNILYLNERLLKFNIVGSPLCSLCGAYESIKHLFCTCTVTQKLWDQLRSWLYEVISFPILEPKTTLLRRAVRLSICCLLLPESQTSERLCQLRDDSKDILCVSKDIV